MTGLVLKLKSPLVEEELFTRQDRLSSQIKVTISRGGTVYPSGPA